MDKTLTDALALAEHYGLTDREVAAAVEAATVARRDEATRPGLVTVTHPGLPDRTHRVDAEAFEVLKQSGWQLVPDPEPEPVEDKPKPKPAKAAAKKETS
jgi:hypothetical protein